MDGRIAPLLDHPRLRLGDVPEVPAQPTGFAALDAGLAGGGWPQGRLTEILPATEAIGELSLLMPALAAFSQQRRWIVWISPPHIPYAPALAAWGMDLATVRLVRAKPARDRLWAAERALRSGVCGAVLMWSATPDPRPLRRLQRAAETGHACGFLFRPAIAASASSPSAVRLAVARARQTLSVHILKGWRQGAAVEARGNRPQVTVRIRLSDALAGAGAASPAA